MILLDANILIYAGIADQPQHREASDWLQYQLRLGHRIGIPWQSLLAFLRTSTNPRLFEKPASITDAWQVVQGWLNLPAVWIPAPTERHAVVLGRLLQGVNAQGNIIADAHLAALAIEHGLELCSADYDFGRFEGLRWQNPLRATRS